MWRKILIHCVFAPSAKTVNPMERRSRMCQMADGDHVASVMKLEGHTMVNKTLGMDLTARPGERQERAGAIFNEEDPNAVQP